MDIIVFPLMLQSRKLDWMKWTGDFSDTIENTDVFLHW